MAIGFGNYILVAGGLGAGATADLFDVRTASRTTVALSAAKNSGGGVAFDNGGIIALGTPSNANTADVYILNPCADPATCQVLILCIHFLPCCVLTFDLSLS